MSLVKLLAEAREDATKDGKVKYPLDCGCSSEHYHGLCDGHKNEIIEDQRTLMGIPHLRLTHRDFLDLPSLVKTLHAIKLQLISNPTKSCLIKIAPGGLPNETNASSRD